ncbi:MAG: hypothetical protein M3Z66_06045 [Chloroflexota bacterium]|nr:hypothetical protein [Chloroflexota bacterium]
MSDWAFVAAAWTIVWGSLAMYAVVLARRVTQAREIARHLRRELDRSERKAEGDSVLCDTPPAP